MRGLHCTVTIFPRNRTFILRAGMLRKIMSNNLFNALIDFDLGNGQKGKLYSLPQLEKDGVGPISKLPISVRIVLESVLRNVDQKRIKDSDVRTLANWSATAERTEEIPFIVARILLQD